MKTLDYKFFPLAVKLVRLVLKVTMENNMDILKAQ
jgi:hypothetical protein